MSWATLGNQVTRGATLLQLEAAVESARPSLTLSIMDSSLKVAGRCRLNAMPIPN